MAKRSPYARCLDGFLHAVTRSPPAFRWGNEGIMDPHRPTWESCWETAGLSDIGLRRANNQDSLAIWMANTEEQWHQRGHLFVVADGMGAHAAGELASKMATDLVPLGYHKLLDRPPHEALVQAVRDANGQIHARGVASEDFRGMGTTVTALAVLSQGAFIAHVGDSRVYRLRGDVIEQLTFDHSLVWELRRAGQFPAGETLSYIPKNIITRSLGPNPEVQVDLEGPFPIQPGDVFLLCSDGLSGQVRDEEIGKVLSILPPQEAVRTLVDLANLRGGPDNITVIVARVAAEPGCPPPETASARQAKAPFGLAWALGLAGALSAAGAGWLFWTGRAALAVALLALAMACALAVRFLLRRLSPAAAVGPQRLGGAPYARKECRPDLEFVTELARIARQLREAATEADWNVAWEEFRAYEAQAEAATSKQQYADATRAYCRAITSMMEQLRHQQPREGDTPSPFVR